MDLNVRIFEFLDDFYCWAAVKIRWQIQNFKIQNIHHGGFEAGILES